MSDSKSDALHASVRRAFERALRRFDLVERTRNACAVHANDPSPRFAMAVGKAAKATLAGAVAAGIDYAGALLVVSDGEAEAPASIAARTERIVAAHPIPDAASERAGHAALALADAAAEERGSLHVFVSGGASALVCAPSPGVDLEMKARVTAALLDSGADISAINVVRRHLSDVKGGGLLRRAGVLRGGSDPNRGARVVRAFLVSDVLAGADFDIGSGPAVGDPTSVADAERVVTRFAPAYDGLPLRETVFPEEIDAARHSVTMLADADAFTDFVVRMLEEEGFAASRIPLQQGTPIGELADALVREAATLKPGEARVESVEPSVIVPAGAGRGGRSTHLAALVASRLPPDVVLLAGATDGVDGGSGTGGAIVSHKEASRAGDSLPRAIQSFDVAPLLESLGVTLKGTPSGLNFADVVIVARGR